MGHGEFLAVWAHGEQRVGLLLRNNFDADNRGAVQLDWSFPIHAKLLGYVQWFYGYGESLIDYNHRVNRLGVGVMLNNWL
jgi:phospholipase A1